MRSESFTEGEVVAMFDLMHEHFGLGRTYQADVCDDDLRSAMEKVGRIRDAIYEEDEGPFLMAEDCFDGTSFWSQSLGWTTREKADRFSPKERSKITLPDGRRWMREEPDA